MYEKKSRDKVLFEVCFYMNSNKKKDDEHRTKKKKN